MPADGYGSERLSLVRKALYATGDIADGIKNASIAYFLLFYLTVVVGLSGTLAGTILAISLVVDAVTDPYFGYLSDNLRSRWGRRHPLMFGAILPFALGFGLLFSVPAYEAEWALFAYALVSLIVLRVAFSAFSVPYQAMTAELAREYLDRSVLMTVRTAFNITTVALCVSLGFSVFFADDNLLSRAAYVKYGWTLAGILLIAASISAVSTLSLRGRLHAVRPTTAEPRATLPRQLRDIFRNPSFVVLFATTILFWTTQGGSISVNVHVYRFFWGFPTDLIQLVLLSKMAGLASGILVCAWMISRFEKRDICLAGIVIVCLTEMPLPFLKIAGVLPEGTPLYLLIGAVQVIYGIGFTSVGISLGSMMADATDEHYVRFGSRREGLYFAGLSLGSKCATGLGGLLMGVLLDLIGFPDDLASRPDQIIPAETVTDLGVFTLPLAALICLLSIPVLSRYRLTRREHDRMQAALRDRAS